MRKAVFIGIAIFSSALQLGAQISSAEYAARRTNLAAKVGDGIVVVNGSPEPKEDYLSFFQNPNFYYLTGFREPDATLVMAVKNGKSANILFVRSKNPAREVWSGRTAGPTLASQLTGIPARNRNDLQKVIDSLSTIYKKVQTDDVERDIAELRGKKSEAELALLRKATDITIEAQRAAIRSVKPGMNEYQAQAIIEYTFRYNGSERPGFATIVGSGPNSTTLHYNVNNRVMQSGEVVVMDIGALYDGYSSDVTRTVPVNGKFSSEQRSIYEIVRRAQNAAVQAAKIGAFSTDMGNAATATIAEGLTQLGLIESQQATYDCGPDGKLQCPQVGLYYMHGLGHSIGLEVHDPGTSAVQPGAIVKGDVFTIEPGIYVRENLLEIIPKTPRNEQLKSKIRSAVERYKNIGVRIEDDYVMTENGPEWISRAPREIEEIEALMQATSK